MPRNLLPRLRQTPTPANIPQATVGAWSRISVPEDLAKLHYGKDDGKLRTRIQSIPSPWARLLQFKNALEDEEHPARALVQSELLDAFEFLWSMRERSTGAVEFRTIRIADLESLAESPVSERVEQFARALLELIPRRPGSSAPAFAAFTIVTVDGRPVMATSPYTVLFTAEDAAIAPTGSFFQFAFGADARALCQRPVGFQRFVAQVLLPQLGHAHSDDNTDVGAIQRLIKPWLEEEVLACRRHARTAVDKAGLDLPSGDGWRDAVRVLRLTQVDALVGSVALYARAAGAEITASRWILNTGQRGSAAAPLILDPHSFDNRYYSGAAQVSLPPNLLELPRDTLPVTGTRYPWVNPAADWFADRILLLAEPIERENVHGFAKFASHYTGPKAHLKAPHTTIPLRRDVLRYFTPEELDERLTIEVQPSGRIEVSLALSIGVGAEAREFIVRRTYDEMSIHHVTGPALALWPRFRSDSWRNYTMFRRDSNPQVARYFEVRGSTAGRSVASVMEQRNEWVSVASYDEAPEAFEVLSTVGSGGGPEHLGIVLPSYRAARSPGDTQWRVGIDFGTSNTVVSIRTQGATAPEIFGVSDLTLPLTRADDLSRTLLDAYFLPHEIRRAPFGTAVVHFNHLPTLDIMSEPIGVRVNIPFNGHVESDDQNRVVGDLKWSTDSNRHFLSASFLRHLLSVILAQAVQGGIRPSQVSVAWAHPRAFTPSQVAQMRSLWEQAAASLREHGVALGPIVEEIDESRAVLRHFFNAGLFGSAGATGAIIDVGGGTSDIAIYGRGATIALDSVMLGGRNLTGRRLQAATAAGQQNAFVRDFVEWSFAHQLSEPAYKVEAAAVRKYLEDGQDHLAFSYLLQTRWFRAHGQQFTGDDACHRFQAMVFYFFGALFYHVGLTLRGDAIETESRVPYLVMLAGNGSQYLHWLTDLSPAPRGSAFHLALGRLLLSGLRATEDAVPPRVELTSEPKREVALGLVAAVQTVKLAEDKGAHDPVIGEAVRARLSSDAAPRALDATSRFAPHDLLQADQVASLVWTGSPMEIERFHDALQLETRSLARHGAHWNDIAARYRSFFGVLDAREIQNAARTRLQYLAQSGNGFRGSLFVLEASTVLDQMMLELFAGEAAVGAGAAPRGRA